MSAMHIHIEGEPPLEIPLPEFSECREYLGILRSHPVLHICHIISISSLSIPGAGVVFAFRQSGNSGKSGVTTSIPHSAIHLASAEL